MKSIETDRAPWQPYLNYCVQLYTFYLQVKLSIFNNTNLSHTGHTVYIPRKPPQYHAVAPWLNFNPIMDK